MVQANQQQGLFLAELGGFREIHGRKGIQELAAVGYRC
jgi:hypothetical protein